MAYGVINGRSVRMSEVFFVISGALSGMKYNLNEFLRSSLESPYPAETQTTLRHFFMSLTKHVPSPMQLQTE